MVREVSTVKLGKGSYKAYITYLVPLGVGVSPLARVPGPHLLAADGGLATLHLVVVTWHVLLSGAQLIMIVVIAAQY